MATKRDFARRYAGRVRKAHQLTEVRDGLTVKEAAVRDVGAEVRAILQEVDGLKFDTGRSLSEADKNDLLELVANELGTEEGTWLHLKEASISSALEFETALALMLQQISYE